MGRARWWACLGLMGSACLSDAPRHDLEPRYGGLDRRADERLVSEDFAMVGIAVERYGGREAASRAFVKQAQLLLERGDWAMAMRRLNSAWVLEPSLPELDVWFERAVGVRDQRQAEGGLPAPSEAAKSEEGLR